MTMPTKWLLALALLVSIVPSAARSDPVDVRCKADGGVALCVEPTVVADPATAPVDADAWTYSLCDFAGAFTWREVTLTTARNGNPIFDPDVVPVSSASERIVHNACQLGVT